MRNRAAVAKCLWHGRARGQGIIRIMYGAVRMCHVHVSACVCVLMCVLPRGRTLCLSTHKAAAHLADQSPAVRYMVVTWWLHGGYMVVTWWSHGGYTHLADQSPAIDVSRACLPAFLPRRLGRGHLPVGRALGLPVALRLPAMLSSHW